jgi:hypothetical protein
MDLKQYMEKRENLPEFMKDFHDQKDLFKTIYDQYREGNAKKLLEDVGWVDAHIFTIDVFLWWMGRHGYKLQKIRKQGLEFNDPNETIKYFTDKRQGRSVKLFEDILIKK